jgi:glycosyltransferase involved in cell wall biosynthesis
MNPNLAIVIPAYKSDFLTETLQSIRDQSDQRFSLYIFDDASPHNIKEIIQQVSFDVSVSFKRFDTNVGRKSLTKQWERCISETANEDWIWLFSDDDIMSPDCVESFYKSVENDPDFSAYRFDTKKISATGEVIRENKFPKSFDGAGFLNQKLSYKQESYIVEYIFSRKAYNEIGGFPNFPLAWTSDDLFCLKLAEYGRISSVDGGCVFWRYSGSNISGSSNRENAKLKLKAAAEFVDWIIDRPNIVEKLQPQDLPLRWFVRQVRSMVDQLTLFDEIWAIKSVSRYDNKIWKYYFKMKKNRSKIIGWLKKFSL